MMTTTMWQTSSIRPTSLITGPNSAFARLFPEKYRQQEELTRKQRSKSTDHQRSNLYQIATATKKIVDNNKTPTKEKGKRLSRIKLSNNETNHRPSRAKSESQLKQIHSSSNDNLNKPDDTKYTQKIGIRYLRPPTPPSPEPIVIHEIESTIYNDYLSNTNRPVPSRTPSPIIVREKPPIPPSYESSKAIKKPILPGSNSLRHVVIKRAPPLPTKPRPIIIEKWLPYKAKKERPVLYQRTTNTEIIHPNVHRNVILEYKPADIKVKQEFQNFGCFYVDPKVYQAKYGSSLRRSESIRKVLESVGCNPDLLSPIDYESNRCSTFKNTKAQTSQSIDKKLDALIGAVIPTAVENHYDVPRVHYDDVNDYDKNPLHSSEKSYLPNEDCDFREAPSSSRNS